MRKETGITLISIVAYIVVFMIIITIVSMISSNFYKNISKIKDTPKYISEMNKFNMFFIADVKNNTNAAASNPLTTPCVLEFEDGTRYVYEDNIIKRNDLTIAKNVKDLGFTITESVDANGFTKTIVEVYMQVGRGKEEFSTKVEYVLKYW